MAVNAKQIWIVGCGPGSEEYVTPAARRAVREADVLLGSARLLALFPERACEKIVSPTDSDRVLALLAELVEKGRRVAVLVSGDPGLFSLAQVITGRFGAAACEVVSAVSSVQVAFARLGLSWADARILSAHGRAPTVPSADLAAADKIAILAGTAEALQWSAAAAKALGETHAAFVCENLTLPQERVGRIEAREIASCGASPLAVVLLVRRTLVP
jgi:precorrin-6y C5,15-methyltransferase (decarboxylating) CbiE subunit